VLELESRTSAAADSATWTRVTRQVPRYPAASDLGEHEIPPSRERVPVGGAAVIINMTDLLTPLKDAVAVTQPEADSSVSAAKAPVVEPCGTVTVAGTVRSGLLLERLTLTLPAALDMVTVHDAFVPAVNSVGVHASEDNTGVDQSVKLAVCEDAPSVAVTEPAPSAAIMPVLAVNVMAALPAGTTTLAGTVTRLDVELRPTVVSAAAVFDRVTVHRLAAPDITPLGLQDNELTTMDAARVIAAVCDEAL
jgi:hypothetical protein